MERKTYKLQILSFFLHLSENASYFLTSKRNSMNQTVEKLQQLNFTECFQKNSTERNHILTNSQLIFRQNQRLNKIFRTVRSRVFGRIGIEIARMVFPSPPSSDSLHRNAINKLVRVNDTPPRSSSFGPINYQNERGG